MVPPGQPLGTRVNVGRAVGILIRQTLAPRRGGSPSRPPRLPNRASLYSLSVLCPQNGIDSHLWAACNRRKIVKLLIMVSETTSTIGAPAELLLMCVLDSAKLGGTGGRMPISRGVITVLRMPTNGREMILIGTSRNECERCESPVIVKGLPKPTST